MTENKAKKTEKTEMISKEEILKLLAKDRLNGAISFSSYRYFTELVNMCQIKDMWLAKSEESN